MGAVLEYVSQTVKVWDMFPLSLVLVGLLSFLLVVFIWKQGKLYYRYFTSDIPGPTLWMLTESFVQIILGKRDILEVFSTYAERYKPIFRLYIPGKCMYVFSDPQDIKTILNGSLHKDPVYDGFKQVIGEALFTAPVDKWKLHRKIIASTFNQKILNSFVDVFAEQSKILVEILKGHCKKGEFVDIYPLLTLCALDAISETANGTKIWAQTTRKEYADWLLRGLDIISNRFLCFWLHSDFVWRRTTLSNEVDQLAANMKEVVQEAIEVKRRDYRKGKNLVVQDDEGGIRNTKAFMDYLVTISEEEGVFTDEQLVNEISQMAIAGSDTSASTAAFVLLMLAMHDDIQNKAYEEQYEIFGDADRDISAEDLSRMTYLEKVIKETLRLFPPGMFFARYLIDDLKLESCILPKGSSCLISVLSCHRDPRIWSDPSKFDPERFSPEEVAKRHPYSYIPFSAGPRNCIGINYAMMVMKTILSAIIRNYKVSSRYEKPEDIKLGVKLTLKSKDPYEIALERRISNGN